MFSNLEMIFATIGLIVFIILSFTVLTAAGTVFAGGFFIVAISFISAGRMPVLANFGLFLAGMAFIVSAVVIF